MSSPEVVLAPGKAGPVALYVSKYPIDFPRDSPPLLFYLL